MKKNIEPLQENSYYHIYNRGINGEVLFKENRNFQYFLDKYAKYIFPIANTYAYCLMKNHFHFAIKTKTADEIIEYFVSTHSETTQIPKVSDIISKQFSHLFNGYTQAINKSTRRTGGLFEEPFLRIFIENDTYLTNLIVYIHRNPQNHEIVKDFKNYKNSSYQSILSNAQTKLEREQVLKLFGGKEMFAKAHESDLDSVDWEKIKIE